MSCEICENKFEKNLIYENDKIKICLALEPATSGHIQLFSQEHYPILEQVPLPLLSYISAAANKVSILLFEMLKVHGTNIIIQNGVPAGQNVPHFSIHIIPRRTDDGLKLDWDLKQAAPDALESIQRIITEGMNTLEQNQQVPTPQLTTETAEVPAPAEEETTEDKEEEKEPDHHKKQKKRNYYLESLERIP